MSIIHWHKKYQDERTVGERASDWLANVMGSWAFVIWQTIVVMIWTALNTITFIAWMHQWDPYPFILLNLLFSTQAAYATPIIMMSQNRQAKLDRLQADAMYETAKRNEKEIARLHDRLTTLEDTYLKPLLATHKKT